MTLTDGGYGKRTPVSEWSRKNRNIQGVRAMRLVADRGGLVGALVCQPGDEVLAIGDTGTVIRTYKNAPALTGIRISIRKWSRVIMSTK